MTQKILIIYSTTDGHTKKICSRIAVALEEQGNEIELVPLNYARPTLLESADKIVIGASIRYGKHSPLVYDFVKTNQALLEAKKNAFFTVNVVARKPEKNTPETNPYLIKFLKQISWQPQLLGVFAGKIHYAKYSPFDRFMIRFIMWMTKGPTDHHTNVEFTDWDQVTTFANSIHEM